MASQRVLLLAIGGALAEVIWRDICHYSAERQSTAEDEWSHEDWPVGTSLQVDALVEKIKESGFTPPILYRSEHVDCWSMGDVFEGALSRGNPNRIRRLMTTNHEIIATLVKSSEKFIAKRSAAPETKWLHARINEATNAWGDLQDERLLIFIRSFLGALWTDGEVSEALGKIPDWWTE